MVQLRGMALQASRQWVKLLDRTGPSHFSTGFSGPLEDHVDFTSECGKSATPHCAFGRVL